VKKILGQWRVSATPIGFLQGYQVERCIIPSIPTSRRYRGPACLPARPPSPPFPIFRPPVTAANAGNERVLENFVGFGQNLRKDSRFAIRDSRFASRNRAGIRASFRPSARLDLTKKEKKGRGGGEGRGIGRKRFRNR